MTDELGLTRRNTLIWEKPNCMPSSAEDRFTVDFEYIYFYTKSQRYWFERQFEPLTENEVGWRRTGNDTRFLYKCYNDKNNHNGQGASTLGLANPLGRNKRCVWTIPTEPYPEAHFATFPQALVIPMIQAGCPPNGIVLDPFAGSGTTLAVAQRLGRRWIGIEINPEYISMAYKRISEYETPLLNLMEDNYV